MDADTYASEIGHIEHHLFLKPSTSKPLACVASPSCSVMSHARARSPRTLFKSISVTVTAPGKNPALSVGFMISRRQSFNIPDNYDLECESCVGVPKNHGVSAQTQ
jgi:hypothetical protein